jgi:membrane protease YdiL (CAAX protease family)
LRDLWQRLVQPGRAPLWLWAAALLLVPLLSLLAHEILMLGYGLDALLARLPPLAASGVLGAAWGAWHLPLFAVNGYYEPFGGYPILSLSLWSILVKTVIMTWGYLASDRSLLLMMLFHFTVNFTGEVILMPPASEAVFQGLLMAVGVLAAYRLWRIGQE